MAFALSLKKRSPFWLTMSSARLVCAGNAGVAVLAEAARQDHGVRLGVHQIHVDEIGIQSFNHLDCIARRASMTGIDELFVFIRHKLIVRAIAAAGENDCPSRGWCTPCLRPQPSRRRPRRFPHPVPSRGCWSGACRRQPPAAQPDSCKHPRRAPRRSNCGTASHCADTEWRAILANQPVKRLADGVGEQLNGRAVVLLVAVRHHILDQLLGGILIAVFLLPLGTGRHRAEPAIALAPPITPIFSSRITL